MYFRLVCLLLATLGLAATELLHFNEHKVSESEIKIYFYCKEIENPTLVDISDPKDLAKTYFSKHKGTYFYFHGFQEDPRLPGSTAQKIEGYILNNFDVNFFLVDWSLIAKVPSQIHYAAVVNKLEAVGEILGRRLKSFVTNNGLSFDNIQLVGHSLGAHLAGITGRVAGGQCFQVLGLDPAGPAFTPFKTSNRLSTDSGKYVQAIHTNGGLLGYLPPLAHSDWYPNGGIEQPMCVTHNFSFFKTAIIPEGSKAVKCAHSMAVEFYLESLCTRNFVAKTCDLYKDYKNGRCWIGKQAWMGGYFLDTSAHGTYYVDTNVQSPYARG
ncbi:unnamed protein product [Psylliodes chrysocephalus]|uniref:Lipase domain-containing protein n=1 Tax=Psylliodes chrysocephalus TaxID=3402493 RepID=A0A9P0CWF6_9CUCU|nr:unnamed protein product [Psylliodes chrysocephala]